MGNPLNSYINAYMKAKKPPGPQGPGGATGRRRKRKRYDNSDVYKWLDGPNQGRKQS